MDAALIAVGTEMLETDLRDSNTEWLGRRLRRKGIRVRMKATVGDDAGRIAALVRHATGTCDLVILTGGLGPTEDDRTRHGVAKGVGLDLETDVRMVDFIRAWFEDRGRTYRPEQAGQAQKPAGSVWLPNGIGTAPGFLLDNGVLVAALPGVPAEMKAMFERHLEGRLSAVCGSVGLAAATLLVGGRTESRVDALLRDLYDRSGVQATILARMSGIEIRLVVSGDSQAHASERLAAVESEMARRLGSDLFGRDDDTMPGVVGAALQEAGKTIAVAESCTAGMIGAALTGIPGSSVWFRGGLIVYDNDLKVSLAGVSTETLQKHGAVSSEVAAELADGARLRCGADIGLAVTGIAGPAGGAPGKPVGTVYIAIGDSSGVEGCRFRFSGDRQLVRGRTVTYALDRLRRHLASGRPGGGRER